MKRFLPRTLFRQNLLLIVVLILLGQLISALVFVFAVQQPRAVRLARLVAQQVLAVQQATVEMTDPQRARFLEAMNVGEEFRIQPATAPTLDQPDFSGFDVPDTFAIRGFMRQLRSALGQRVQVVRWQAQTRSIWIGLMLGDDSYWITLRGGQLLPVAPWLFIGISAGATVLALLGAIWISRRINRPLGQLVAAAQVMGKGVRPPHLDVRGPQEIASVAASFNQLADDLARLDRERTVMLAGVSHDVRTPLAKLRLALDISEPRLEPELFEQMGRYVDDIDALLDQFLAFARIGSDEQIAATDVSAMINSLVDTYRRAEHPIATTAPEGLIAQVRPMAFRRLLVNLLDNAIKYGECDVSLIFRVDRDRLLLEVADGGPGIPAAEIERLMQPFARANAARAGTPGAGLGLAIVRKIVDLHGGELALGGRVDGRPGLCVRVSLPLASAEAG